MSDPTHSVDFDFPAIPLPTLLRDKTDINNARARLADNLKDHALSRASRFVREHHFEGALSREFFAFEGCGDEEKDVDKEEEEEEDDLMVEEDDNGDDDTTEFEFDLSTDPPATKKHRADNTDTHTHTATEINKKRGVTSAADFKRRCHFSLMESPRLCGQTVLTDPSEFEAYYNQIIENSNADTANKVWQACRDREASLPRKTRRLLRRVGAAAVCYGHVARITLRMADGDKTIWHHYFGESSPASRYALHRCLDYPARVAAMVSCISARQWDKINTHDFNKIIPLIASGGEVEFTIYFTQAITGPADRQSAIDAALLKEAHLVYNYSLRGPQRIRTQKWGVITLIPRHSANSCLGGVKKTMSGALLVRLLDDPTMPQFKSKLEPTLNRMVWLRGINLPKLRWLQNIDPEALRTPVTRCRYPRVTPESSLTEHVQFYKLLHEAKRERLGISLYRGQSLKVVRDGKVLKEISVLRTPLATLTECIEFARTLPPVAEYNRHPNWIATYVTGVSGKLRFVKKGNRGQFQLQLRGTGSTPGERSVEEVFGSQRANQLAAEIGYTGKAKVPNLCWRSIVQCLHSVSAILAGIGRVAFGELQQRSSFRTAIGGKFIACLVGAAGLVASSLLGSIALYFAAILVIFFAITGTLASVSATLGDEFGETFVARNLSVVQLTEVLSTIVLAAGTALLFDRLGVTLSLTAIAVLSLLPGLVIIYLYRPATREDTEANKQDV
ncbi:unnamed protein product [Vitrella brassicaformis CCMP3155]|uniref:Uncharacterized protein n=1 Tax=Vitrella brassicaformis (strain CCMP3155) TaxID=1169540 RepID=A0A0G4GS20_VITBC|nr:unnamed protein product [Vitrella brassicaformis CCMP3155]|eukprot:CEM33409.1 unnamed protein product [Vitrella brassicaformis CCMP3155]